MKREWPTLIITHGKMQGHLSAYVNGEKTPIDIHFTYKHITVVLVDIQLNIS